MAAKRKPLREGHFLHRVTYKETKTVRKKNLREKGVEMEGEKKKGKASEQCLGARRRP